MRRRLLPHAAGSIPMLPSAAPSPFAAPGFAKLPCSLLQSQLGLSCCAISCFHEPRAPEGTPLCGALGLQQHTGSMALAQRILPAAAALATNTRHARATVFKTLTASAVRSPPTPAAVESAARWPQQSTSTELDVVDGWLSVAGVLLHPLWLRQRCRAPSHVQPGTNQRLFELTDLGHLAVSAALRCGQDAVHVSFSDGHVSRFELQELLDESALSPENCTDQIRPSMWSGKDSEISKFEFSARDLVNVSRDRVLTPRQQGIAELAAHMVKYGLAIVRGLPAADGVCHDFASLFGNIRATNWGPVFNVENKLVFKREEDACSMPDVAYTNLGIPLHVDNPYREPAPGFQLLHCIVQDTESHEGGMNMAADGLHIAQTLRARDEAVFRTLSTVPVKFEYSDGNILLRRARPHIEIDPLKGACGGIGEFGFKAINWSGRLDYVPALAPVEMTKYFQARETLVEVTNPLPPRVPS